ncbi:response regulator [Cohnella algarum]|uniref:response regulator n=1 Tax=Cohnella algarum TaxID=2044859 RepID=UPI001967775E|nr:response regulator [Cohnella algarum]MBN2982431.1 response regulator [Cohnella algarum]
MYKILVVDDEPRVSAGIKNLLLASNLDVVHVETAHNGFEALDYLRMDAYDLVLTDIQMSMMNGIELMEAIYMEQPHLPIVVISAHEKFDFAKKSLRLGARDYLVKPVELEELIRVVKRVLLEKGEAGRKALERTAREQSGEERLSQRKKALIELITEKDLQPSDYAELTSQLGARHGGVRYGLLTVHFEFGRAGFSNREITLRDRKLLKFASVNIAEESLADWNGLAFYDSGSRLVAVIEFDDGDVPDRPVQVKSQLNLIGQSLCMNLKQYLNVEATVGISTLCKEASALPRLLEEAATAVRWRSLHPSNRVFYYEDMVGPGGTNYMDWVSRVHRFVEGLKLSGGEASPEETGELVRELTGLSRSPELFNSCFGLLAYRLYGLLLECAQGTAWPLHRFDPDAYFRAVSPEEKAARLDDYIAELCSLLGQCLLERDQSIVARVTEYIRAHFRDRGLKVQDIAGEVHFSPAYVSYLFKKVMKVNVWEYVTAVRIEEAKRLLATTDKKRYEIAYQVGYESPEHFSRIFKRSVGVSPADYRKERQGESD